MFVYTCSAGSMFICPLCETEVSVAECFRDKAFTMEFKKATIQCTSPACPWEGKSDEYKVQLCNHICMCINAISSIKFFQDHLNTCKFAILSCLHSTYGCKEQLPRIEISIHVDKCQYKPVKCKWCHENVLDMQYHITAGDLFYDMSRMSVSWFWSTAAMAVG
jgi:hypothetical protein